MNTATIATSSPKNESVFRRLARNFGAALVRGLELAGAPYKDGAIPLL
jgi:hypothetical protein